MENNLPQVLENKDSLSDSSVNQQNVLSKKKRYLHIFVFTVLLIALISLLNFFIFNQSIRFPHEQNLKREMIQQPTITLGNVAEFTYKIVDGSVYKIYSNDRKEIFIDKKSLKTSEDDHREIIEFDLSPDKSKLLIKVEVGLTPYFLYSVDIKSRKSNFIYPAMEAIWSPDSRYIAYTCPPADIGPRRLFIYDTSINSDVEIGDSINQFTSYTNLTWSADSQSIYADFERRDDIPNGNIIDKGKTQIKLN